MKLIEKDCLDLTVTIEQPALPMVRHGLNRKEAMAFGTYWPVGSERERG